MDFPACPLQLELLTAWQEANREFSDALTRLKEHSGQVTKSEDERPGHAPPLRQVGVFGVIRLPAAVPVRILLTVTEIVEDIKEAHQFLLFREAAQIDQLVV